MAAHPPLQGQLLAATSPTSPVSPPSTKLAEQVCLPSSPTPLGLSRQQRRLAFTLRDAAASALSRLPPRPAGDFDPLAATRQAFASDVARLSQLRADFKPLDQLLAQAVKMAREAREIIVLAKRGLGSATAHSRPGGGGRRGP